MFRRRATINPSDTPAVSREIDAGRIVSILFTILFFGGAISIVVMSFARGN